MKVVKLVEDDQLRDELPNEDADETDEEDYSYWNHTYTTNLPETREISTLMGDPTGVGPRTKRINH